MSGFSYHPNIWISCVNCWHFLISHLIFIRTLTLILNNSLFHLELLSSLIKIHASVHRFNLLFFILFFFNWPILWSVHWHVSAVINFFIVFKLVAILQQRIVMEVCIWVRTMARMNDGFSRLLSSLCICLCNKISSRIWVWESATASSTQPSITKLITSCSRLHHRSWLSHHLLAYLRVGLSFCLIVLTLGAPTVGFFDLIVRIHLLTLE